ncbi:fasciclin domain-containing protein [Myxococcota bacterium]|nr:fasciclin domain-containing protein [Myxococcota bacterium]
MRTVDRVLTIALVGALTAVGCTDKTAPSASAPAGPASKAAPAPASAAPAKEPGGIPPLDPDNIVSIAVGSKDHTTLVAALKAADYVTSIANPGPLTVFAPTNDAFAKLPKGTVEGLLVPEKQADLKDILKYHATTSTLETKFFKDGQEIGMANGKKVKLTVADGKVKVNDANIVASIRASNGIVHVIDGVLLPPAQ